jgi:hypothetical protein
LPYIETLAVEIPEIKNEIDKFKSVISLEKRCFPFDKKNIIVD